MPRSRASTSFLTLSNPELVVLMALHKASEPETGIPDRYIDGYLKTVGAATLLRHCHNDPALLKKLKQPKYLSRCQRYLQNYADLSKLVLRDQPGIHPIDLVRGHCLYSQATREEKGSPAYFECLLAAEKLGSYHAMFELNTNDFRALKKVLTGELESDKVDPVAIFTRAYKAAELHGTPGCWMMVETCYYLASFYKHIGDDSAISYQVMLQYCYLGKLLTERSADAIANAYNGEAYPKENVLTLSDPVRAYRRYIDIACEGGANKALALQQAEMAASASVSRAPTPPPREPTPDEGSRREAVPIRN